MAQRPSGLIKDQISRIYSRDCIERSISIQSSLECSHGNLTEVFEYAVKQLIKEAETDTT